MDALNVLSFFYFIFFFNMNFANFLHFPIRSCVVF